MPETPQTAGDIQEIRFRLEAIEATQLLLVRNQDQEFLVRYMSLFDANSDLAAIYLLVDGSRTQAEILSELHDEGSHISQSMLSRRMRTLHDAGLIERVPSSRTTTVYEKNRIVERVLQLSKKLS